MTQSHDEMLARVRRMATGTGQLRDLSPGDQEALRHVLALLDAITENVAYTWRWQPKDVLTGFAERLLEKQGENGGDIVRDDLSDKVGRSLRGDDDE